MEVTQILVSLIAGVASGFVGAVTGGAGILAIPVLIFLGLSADRAIATNALATFGMTAAALPQYTNARKVHWRVAAKLTPLAIIGGYIGSKTLTRVNADALTVVVGVLLLLMVLVVLLSSHRGLKAVRSGSDRTAIGYAVYFLVMLYGGFLGAGAGLFAVYAAIFFLGMTYIDAKATISVPSLFLAVTAFIVFVTHNLVSWKFGVPMTVGMYIGGAIGAKTALEKGNAWVRVVFVAVTLASSAKLLFFR